jgi:hypothetical protein
LEGKGRTHRKCGDVVLLLRTQEKIVLYWVQVGLYIVVYGAIQIMFVYSSKKANTCSRHEKLIQNIGACVCVKLKPEKKHQRRNKLAGFGTLLIGKRRMRMKDVGQKVTFFPF